MTIQDTQAPRLSLTPWKVEHSAAREAYVVKDASGYDVAVMLTDFTTDWANAHLIAAAPELLEALEYVQETIRIARNHFPKSMNNSDRFRLENTCATVSAAIRKAKGSL